MATKQRKGAYIAGGEMRVPKTAGEMRREAARKVKAKSASQLKAARTARKPIGGGGGKPAMTRVNPATHKANLESGEKVAEASVSAATAKMDPKEAARQKMPTAGDMFERKAAVMDNSKHIDALKKDAKYDATKDKGSSHAAFKAKMSAKDDYSHISNLIKNSRYDKMKEKK